MPDILPHRIPAEPQVLHHPVETAAKVVQLADADRRLHGLFQGLQGVSAVTARLADVVRHRRSPREDHVVGHGHVRGDNGSAARDELPPNLGGAARHEARRVEPVLAQVAVVGDMANIVEFGARTNVRGGERGTVHGAVASDFDIIVNLDVAEMTDFSRAPVGAYGIAEAVAADGGVRMNLAILADLAVESHEHLGMYDRTR